MNRGVVVAIALGIGAIIIYLFVPKTAAAVTPVTTGGIPIGTPVANRPVGPVATNTLAAPIQSALTGLTGALTPAQANQVIAQGGGAGTPETTEQLLIKAAGVNPTLNPTPLQDVPVAGNYVLTAPPGISNDTSNLPILQPSGTVTANPSPVGDYVSDVSAPGIAQPGISTDDFTNSLDFGLYDYDPNQYVGV